MKFGADLHTLTGCIHRSIETIRDLLLLSGMEREAAHTAAMRMREIAQEALRQAARTETPPT